MPQNRGMKHVRESHTVSVSIGTAVMRSADVKRNDAAEVLPMACWRRLADDGLKRGLVHLPLPLPLPLAATATATAAVLALVSGLSMEMEPRRRCIRPLSLRTCPRLCTVLV